MPKQQPQPPHPQHQRHLQLHTCYTTRTTPPPQPPLPSYTICYLPQIQDQQQQHQHQLATEAAAIDEYSSYSYTENGCNYANAGAGILSDENGPVCATAASAASAASFAMSAANMFLRNCCGGGETTTDSSSSSGSADSRRQILLSRQRPSSTCNLLRQPATNLLYYQSFEALWKKLKSKQIADLIQAVKSRVEPPTPHPKCNGGLTSSSASTTSYLQCILIKSNSPSDQLQHVFTCRLFFWPELRNADELRRHPTCPSALDYVYVCCNPLHWYRMTYPIDSELAPPPYQRSKMLRLRDTDSEGNTQNNNEQSSSASWTVQSNNNNNNSSSSSSSGSHHSRSISTSIIKKEAAECLQSFTTSGKDGSACTQAWCQIAYWELAQRIGELFHATKPVLNIHADGSVDCAGESLCLRELQGKGNQRDSVQSTRQKVGLGVTLSVEGGDVWIYNRSNVPVFVDSPTLAERMDRVCRVMPGHCLKAFDTHRALVLASQQSQPTHLGPIDRFSMKISFEKGWGNKYKRPDIMGCPCWLEVHFCQLR
ncbi:GH19558 [Drosophila grimshawi]|uniref:Mothers against decapentaplegic homolog n=2 Tax=Drosophila grimshawi TaxID=7222 RepID=B4JHE4_DROGR|nr:GH19558 [Drosophila grimshawi]